MTKRQFLGGLGALTAGILGTGAVKTAVTGTAAAADREKDFPVRLTDDEWRNRLTPEQYRVLRAHGTERAGTSPLNHEKRDGTFHCAGCEHPLFDSKTKYESGTGWPSFYAPLDGAVGTSEDRTLWMVRTEVHCANCGGHLGHVFPDGPPPTGLRYCMNGVAMSFTPEAGGAA